jgi:hypothetical protein
LSDGDRWRNSEPPSGGPSSPPDQRFDPFATGLGVFFAVAIPFFVIGWTRTGFLKTALIVLGIALGLFLGVLAAAWLVRRDGVVWRDSGTPPRRRR